MTDLAATHRRLVDLGLRRATLLVDPARARANIARFADRARNSGVTLRPHFKTHQSADVATWFTEANVACATVSSLGQAAYFADHGWRDLTLAIGLNPRELPEVAALARRVALGVTVDHLGQVASLAEAAAPVGVWVEVDTGAGRAGVDASDPGSAAALLRAIERAPTLAYRGLLTHAGHSYGARPHEAATIHQASCAALAGLREHLRAAGLPGGLLSAGDTPGFAAVESWTGLDEARPGNFVFHDLMQLASGVCSERDLACAVAAPVIGVYPDQRRVVVHAGAVHLSKDALQRPEGPMYGRLLTMNATGFDRLADEGVLVSLSQEHGTVALASEGTTRAYEPGDLVLIAPVHSCLTCEQFGSYLTVAGERLARYVSASSSRPDSASRASGGRTNEV
ncbi:alanine racemase [bacterium]|nr:alanine racemase [bacterium]